MPKRIFALLVGINDYSPAVGSLDNPARRDEHTETRDRVAARLATPEAQAVFDRRSSIAETPFGDLKSVLGLRQFRHRGLEKVEQEWRWSCRESELQKLVRAILRWRQEFAAAMALELV